MIRKKRPKSIRMNMDDRLDLIPNVTYGYIPSDNGADLDNLSDIPSGDWDDA